MSMNLDNKIGNEGCKFLLEFLKENNSLLTLDINSNSTLSETLLFIFFLIPNRK